MVEPKSVINFILPFDENGNCKFSVKTIEGFGKILSNKLVDYTVVISPFYMQTDEGYNVLLEEKLTLEQLIEYLNKKGE